MKTEDLKQFYKATNHKLILGGKIHDSDPINESETRNQSVKVFIFLTFGFLFFISIFPFRERKKDLRNIEREEATCVHGVTLVVI